MFARSTSQSSLNQARWRPLIGLALASALTCAPGTSAWGAGEPGGQREALVIGNSAYENFDALANPVNDANAMCDKLTKVGFKTHCHSDVKDRAALMRLVKDFAASLSPDSQTMFFYAGHAVQVRGENYLVPTGANVHTPQDIDGQFVAMSDVLSALGTGVGRFQMVVLDACRNNPFAPRVTKPGEAKRSASRAAMLSALTQSKAQYGLSAIKDAPAGTIVLYATAAEDAAFDGLDGHGPLTKHLLAHLDTPGLSVEETIKRVTAGVQNDTLKGFGKRQTPFVYSSFTGSFCFAGCAKLIDQAELDRVEREKAALNRKLDEQTRKAEDAERGAPSKKNQVIITPTF